LPYQLSWYTEKRILYQQYAGVLTEAELIAADNEATNLVQSGTAPVHIIADTTSVEKFPMSLSQANRLLGKRAEGLGWVVTISHNRAMNFLVSVVLQVRGVETRFATSLDEALVFLCHRDPSLKLEELRQIVLKER